MLSIMIKEKFTNSVPSLNHVVVDSELSCEKTSVCSRNKCVSAGLYRRSVWGAGELVCDYLIR